MFQEVLHRFVALKRDLVDEVFSIQDADVERTKTIVPGRRRLSARDAVHLAIMEREGVQRILTFDTGFDGVPGLERISG